MSKAKIIFFGTPGFAQHALNTIVTSGHKVCAVVTVEDRLAGRGMNVQTSPVKDYAISEHISVLQPANLKDPEFLASLKAFEANLYVVVAFRKMPKVVWEIPKMGTFNLHGSLLPNYKGAAPINWAIINGETRTGVTTFFINETIDSGTILLSESVDIHDQDNAGMLHDKLQVAGGDLILKTISVIESGNFTLTEQEESAELRLAPKIFRAHCRINWNQPTSVVMNFIRGLSPFPGAFSTFQSTDGDTYSFKIFETKNCNEDVEADFGKLKTDGKSFLRISTNNGLIEIIALQISGKKRMNIKELLNGFPINENWTIKED